MENTETIVESCEGSIKVVRYNRPKKKNAIDTDMYLKVTRILNEAAKDGDVSMLVLTGTGDYYCSGNDISQHRDVSFIAILRDYIQAFITFPKILIAIVNGPAVGVAVTTLALCDLVFASEDAFFYTPFSKLGITAEGCSTFTFPRLIGDRKTAELLLFCQKMSAKEALECGLVNYLYKPEEIQSKNKVKKETAKMKRSNSLSSITDLFRPNNPRRMRPRDLSNTRLSILRQEIKTDLHMIPLKDVYNVLHTNPNGGLTSAQAANLLKYHGHNTLTPSSQAAWPRILVKSMCTGFSILIWLGALLCLVAYLIECSTSNNGNKDNLYLGCVLILVDTFCGLFSFFQNYKSSKIMKSFNNMIPTYTQCIRDGVLNIDTPVRNLVKGDIVLVNAGDVVPADIRIISSKGFKVDNSSLTGESVAVPRGNTEGTPNILESSNVAFFSTQCVEGSAKGVVLCCGDLTALGRVAGLAARLQPAPSPLSREISHFMRYMTGWALGLGILIAISSLALGYPFIQTTIFVIGIVVANIPEGLQPTVTAALTLTAQKMVTKNCLVKNLEAIEALGACTTICSDKTGTLTENKMAVRDVWVWNKTYPISSTFASYQENPALRALKLCGSLCSNAVFTADGSVQGDASESAILNFLRTYDDPIGLRGLYPKVAEIPFNSVNKYQVSVHQNPSKTKYTVMMKGAPESILLRSLTIASDNKTTNLSKDMRNLVEKAVEELANTGERVLGFADLELDPTKFPPNYEFDAENINFPLENMRFLGLMGLMDPPRKEVFKAIERVRSAGVRVMMITGDHPATARAIAEEVGITTSGRCHVVTGAELRNMSPDLLLITLEKHYEIVFARTSPTQKLQIVEACQRQGGIVAVTGDGVNDAPALRRADIGISMGITGSQVSKQTADIVLLDDNFATIVVGLEEGRKIFDNLKKSICYILISNVPEIIPVFMFILFSIPLPLGVMTILCVDLGTDMWPAVALAHEKAESDVMARPPRFHDPLVSSRMLNLVYGHHGLIEFAAGMFAYFVVMAEHGFYPGILFGIRQRWDNEAISDLQDSLGQEWTFEARKHLERAAQATYFVAIVIMQMVNSVCCKTRYNSIFHVGMRNTCLNIGLVFELMLACLICYCPGINDFFRAYPIRLRWWFLALPFAATMIAFDEFRKYCIRKRKFGGWYNDMTYY